MPRKPSNKAVTIAPVADIELPASLDMRHARHLKRSLDELMAREAVLIDSAAVSRVSTGCVQVIAGFALAKSRAGHAVTLRQPTDAMTRAFADLGLDLRGLVKEQR
ncbi:MAG: STAS domain-containing protein [Hyphomicrobiaceae bacterium]|nr:STAS domain-containing protein [Hyphomicrobiaceae bacterium]